MKRLTLVLAALTALALVLAACGETEGKKGEEAKEAQKAPPVEGEAKTAPAVVPAEPVPAEAVPAEAVPAEAPAATVNAAVEAAPLAYDLAKPLAEAGRYVPDGLIAVSVVDFSAVDNMISTFLPGGELFKIPDEKRKALEEELAAYHKKKLGFAVRRVDSAVIFVTATGDLGILIKGVIEEAEDTANEAKQVEGHRMIELGQPPDLRVFSIKDFGVGLYTPKTTSLEDYLRASLERKTNPERFAAFNKDLSSRTDAWFMTVVDFTNPLIAMVWPPDAPVARPDRGIIAFKNTGLVVELEAGKQCLDDIDNWVNMGKAQGKLAISMAKSKLDELEVAEGTGVIIADALFEDAFNSLAPKRSEGKMTLELDLELWGAMPIIGILSAVAIPAFIKYQRRAKTSEAIDVLDKIYKGAADYYATPRVDENGNRVEPHFPPSVGPTPPPGTCCGSLGGMDMDGNDMCDVNPDAWANETWAALKFRITDQHYFTYEFKSNGKTGTEAAFEAVAYGDLDCDGVRSTFMRSGKGIQESPGEYWVESGHLYTENETE